MKKIITFTLMLATYPIISSINQETPFDLYPAYTYYSENLYDDNADDLFNFNFDENQNSNELEYSGSSDNSSNFPYNSIISTGYQYKNIPDSLNLPDTTNSSDNPTVYFSAPIQFYPISYFEHLDEHGNLDKNYIKNARPTTSSRTYDKEAKKAYESRPEVKARRNLNAQIRKDKKRQQAKLSNNPSTLTPLQMKKQVYKETKNSSVADKAYRKAYKSTPEYQEHHRAKMLAYYAIPENRERKKLYKRNRYAKYKQQETLSNSASNSSFNSSEEEYTNNKSQHTK